MLVGATVFAALVLLVLLAERGGGMVWQGGAQRVLYHCAPCDLRYPRDQLVEEAASPRCPRGHPVQTPRDGSGVSTFLICVCAVFVVAGTLLALSGSVSAP